MDCACVSGGVVQLSLLPAFVEEKKGCAQNGRAQALKNQYLETLEAAKSIPAEKEKSNALWSICRQSLDGELSCKELREVADWTLGFVDQIPILRIRSYALSRIFFALKSAKDGVKAAEVLKKIKMLIKVMTSKVDQFKATFVIAEAVAKTQARRESLKYLGKSVKIAKSFSEDRDRDYAFYAVVHQLVKMRENFFAEDLAKKIADQSLNERALSLIYDSEKENLVASL